MGGDISFSPEFMKGLIIVMVAMYLAPAGFLPGFYISLLLFTSKESNRLFRLLFASILGIGSVIAIWYSFGKSVGFIGLPGQGRVYVCLIAIYLFSILLVGKKLRPFFAFMASCIIGIIATTFTGFALTLIFSNFFGNYFMPGKMDYSNTANSSYFSFWPIICIIGIEVLILAIHFLFFKEYIKFRISGKKKPKRK